MLKPGSRMRIRPSIVTIIAAAALTACAGLQRASSGQIGCPSDEIAITDKSRGWSSVTWTASCRGNTYYCAAVSTGKDEQISCKQAVAKSSAPTSQSAATSAASSGGAAAPAAAAGSPAGCQYDTQCKGERICKAGQCVDP